MKNLEYPKTYIVWDLETSGLEKEKCKILEIGCAKVVDGEIVEKKSWVLNHGIKIPDVIRNITGITDILVEKEGKDPKIVMRAFGDFLTQNSEYAHITHNGMRFDIEWLAYHMKDTLGWDTGAHKAFLEWLYKGALDTAVFVKANKLNMSRKWNETFKEFSDRVMNVRAYGVKYNVAICCEELGIDRTGVSQHRALGDVTLTNEIYKKLLAQN